MSDLKIIRGKDIELRINDRIIFGVTEFTAHEKTAFHEVRECMSSKPVALVPQEPEYEIKLTLMSMFDGQIPENRVFSLSLRYDDEEYVYGGCRVLSRDKVVKAMGGPLSVYTISAEDRAYHVIEEDEDE